MTVRALGAAFVSAVFLFFADRSIMGEQRFVKYSILLEYIVRSYSEIKLVTRGLVFQGNNGRSLRAIIRNDTRDTISHHISYPRDRRKGP